MQRNSSSRISLTVKLLTLATLSGCAVIHDRYGESCKSRAYVNIDKEAFIRTRFLEKSPVRVAVIPFSTPANLSAYDNERPGMGNELAWRVQAELLRYDIFPIVEVFNRQDWPRKKEEFYTGNFGAISYAREAGYDLAVIGNIRNLTRLDTLEADTKLVELESGITLWYGTTTVVTQRRDLDQVASFFYLTDVQPNNLQMRPMVDELAQCLASDLTSDPEEEGLS